MIISLDYLEPKKENKKAIIIIPTSPNVRIDWFSVSINSHLKTNLYYLFIYKILNYFIIPLANSRKS